MFILNRGEKQLSAVWAFLKFMSLPQPSAKWFLGSGYYPQNLDAFKLPEVKKIMDANPQYNYLLKLYDESKGMTFLSPVWVPSFGDLNQFYVDTIVEFGKGKYTAEKAVEVMVAESKRVLDTYNRLKK